MEVGLGIAYQNSPPLYLMDGEHRIMISDAINESDRLSSSNKRVRKRVAPDAGVFQVYSVMIGGDRRTPRTPERGRDATELQRGWNLPERSGLPTSCSGKFRSRLAGGNIDESRFNGPLGRRAVRVFLGTVPISNGVFRKIVIRKSRIAQVDVRDLSILRWTEQCYYEVCANPAVYAALAEEKSSAVSG